MTFDLAENAERALRMVTEAPEITYDTEGTGLDWRYNNPVGYVIGAPSGEVITQEDVVYVPVRHGGGGNLLGGRPIQAADAPIEVHPFEVALARAFDERNRKGLGRTIGHNIKFDCHFSANTGVMLGRNLVCTQGQEAILNEYTTAFSLDACAKIHKVTAKRGDELYAHLATLFGGRAEKARMENFWRLAGTDPLGYDYAIGDGVTTFQLAKAQWTKIEEENLTVVANLENDLLWTIFRMERRGIKVDPLAVKGIQEAAEKKIRDLLEKFPLGFNVRSPTMVRDLFMSMDMTDWPLTEKGNPSFTEKWLLTSEMGKAIIEIRQTSNLINSFVGPLVAKHTFKGRVHANLNPLKIDGKGTISGRFSCSNPNLQQVPKRNKDIAKPFRKAFVADPGFLFWERDFSQCEPRLFAHYSEDPNLVGGYNQEPFVDAHSVVAKLLNVERDPTAKRMNMGIFTGMQAKSLAGHMGWSEEQAQSAIREWFVNFPGVKDFQNKAKSVLLNRGYVKTILGRRCRLEHPRFAYHGTSKIIQGSNADILKYKLLQADKACESTGDVVQVHMTVHDSFNGQFEDTPAGFNLLHDIVKEMESVQGPPFNLKVPFVLEGGEGKNWSEATFGVDK